MTTCFYFLKKKNNKRTKIYSLTNLIQFLELCYKAFKEGIGGNRKTYRSYNLFTNFTFLGGKSILGF